MGPETQGQSNAMTETMLMGMAAHQPALVRTSTYEPPMTIFKHQNVSITEAMDSVIQD